MKLFLVLGLIFGIIFNFASYAARSKERTESGVVKQKAKGLEVSVVADKRRYKRSEHLKLQVMLINSGDDPLYIYGTLEWGYSASLTLHVRDVEGKEVQSRFLDDALTPPIAADPSAFVKLQPLHFLGTYYHSSIHELNIQRPGKYVIFVEYHSPVLTTEINLSPLWTRERGTLRSNFVYVEVVR